MKKLSDFLKEIKSIYFSELDNDSMYEKSLIFWKDYYKFCEDNNTFFEEIENLRVDLENECYSVYQEPKYENISMDKVKSAIVHLEEVIFKNKNGQVDGISMEEVISILDCVIYKVRRIYCTLGVSILNSSLNGYCELGQNLSIRPLESLGLKVTKNRASQCFNYPLNHCFGTVNFPILSNGVVENKTFLVDTTYRRFFTSIRCNEGMYFNENRKPDPGYFVKDRSFAKNLMRDGYILLDEYTAYCYGEPFYLSSLDKNDINMKSNINYFDNIINNDSDYALEVDSFEGLEVKFPTR